MGTSDYRRERRLDEAKVIQEEWRELEDQDRWECIRCSWCCKTGWRINLTWYEYKRMMDDPRFDSFRTDRLEEDPATGRTHPFYKIEGRCPLLKGDNICSVYPDWPYTCATYPFLLMPDGSMMVHNKCAGFGHGDLVDEEEMRGKIIRERKRAGMI